MVDMYLYITMRLSTHYFIMVDMYLYITMRLSTHYFVFFFGVE